MLSKIGFNVNDGLLQPVFQAGTTPKPTCDAVFTGVVASGRGPIDVVISWGDTDANDEPATTVLPELPSGTLIRETHTYTGQSAAGGAGGQFTVAICVVSESGGKTCDSMCSNFVGVQPVVCKAACTQCRDQCGTCAGQCTSCEEKDPPPGRECATCPAECGQFSCSCRECSGSCAGCLNDCRPFANCPDTPPPTPAPVKIEGAGGAPQFQYPYFVDCTRN